MTDLSEVRASIDAVDEQMLELFCRRMALASDVARAKAETGKATFDPAREREKLYAVAQSAPAELRSEAVALFSLLMSMNKAAQQRHARTVRGDSRAAAARATFRRIEEPFPSCARVGCQGVEGAYSQLAACRLFEVPQIAFAPTFEGVFRMVRDGACDFGVLPIENSTAGSVNAVYDLLARYRFSIVRSLRLRIEHDLLGLPGSDVAVIREVVSHEQALAQCAGFLERLGARPRVCENTAQAARIVAEEGRRELAALSSHACAALYGLDVLKEAVQDEDSNYTRFVVIAKDPAVYPGATRSSIMLTLGNEPGALYRVLERFFALHINLVKLESRPIPGRDFEFAFYFDLECPAGSAPFETMLDSLDDVCRNFTYFGSYTEVL